MCNKLVLLKKIKINKTITHNKVQSKQEFSKIQKKLIIINWKKFKNRQKNCLQKKRKNNLQALS
jgi:hypothetical protein